MKLSKKITLMSIILLVAASIVVLIKIPINLGLDLQGGSRLILEAQIKKNMNIEDAVAGTLGVIRSRIDSLGVAEPIIQRKGIKQIIVELPGVKEPKRAIKLIGETALLEFVEAEWAPADASVLTKEKLEILAGKEARLGYVVSKDKEGNVVSERPIILKRTALTGADLKGASPGTDSYGRPSVSIEFNAKGTKKFRDVTAKSVGKPIAILLDRKVISAPNVEESISGGLAQITGNFTAYEVRDLVIKLKAGALPVPVKVISNKIIGPTLGKDSIEKSKKAGLIGFVLVCLFMIYFYKKPGIVASIALIIYMLFSLAVLKIFNATLTLPGIAGLILTLGIAVDANVIIFERIKEEEARGDTLKSSIDKGFKIAFRTILDANITTLMSAFVLFWLGTGTIKGFAVTLSIGILVSMFTAIFVTHVLLELVSDFKISKKI
jgi:preprotein translocase subunit SecD